MWPTNILYQNAAQLVWLPAMLPSLLLLAAFPTLVTSSAPPGFPSSGNGLWYTSPAKVWTSSLPVGNGYLAAMSPGGTTYEQLQLNIESLWAGGPFADPSYNGGNKQPSERDAMAQAMQQIRQSIFQSTTGDINDISILSTDLGAYGSYAGSGYLVTTLNTSSAVSNYFRYLDMDNGIVKAIWTQSSTTFTRTTFCSNSAKSCIQHLTSSANSTIPTVTYVFSSGLQQGLPTPNITCLDSNKLVVRGLVSDPGLAYELIFSVSTMSAPAATANVSCRAVSSTNSTLTVSNAQSVWISWVGDTDYSMDAGNAAHNFSFKGPDPHDSLVQLISSGSLSGSFDTLLSDHIKDYQTSIGSFQLSIGQEPDFNTPTDVLRAAYKPYYPSQSPSELVKKATPPGGSPYIEYLTFNFGRYLLHGSTRSVLPANLQGKWALETSNPWGADYHANINLQMNYWSAEMSFTDSKSVIKPLFDYIEKTWAPRGAETAQVLYNISHGWVTHHEMNIFGQTGMPPTAKWGNYPESAVWMMIHVWDHFDHTNDIQWFKEQGWPLIKGVASFHLEKLISDLHFNDSTLVVNPCNSPEQVPITFGCAGAQQIIWQLFNSIEKGFNASGDTDTPFLQEIQKKRAQMDKGLHIGSWGQLQEWKFDQDQPNDTHRHLSHLIGLYPGYAISSYNASVQNATPIGKSGAYTKQQILNATTTSLIHRGNGTGPDADAGWEKAWRAAAWAQLGNKEEFYRELTYTVSEDFGPTLLSLYNPSDPDPIFQIDANLGYPGAVLNALIQAPDVSSYSSPLVITLLPALPTQWAAQGFIRGARVRGGITIDLEWKNGSPSTLTLSVDSTSIDSHGVQRFDPVPRHVELVFNGKTVVEFQTAPGLSRTINQF